MLFFFFFLVRVPLWPANLLLWWNPLLLSVYKPNLEHWESILFRAYIQPTNPWLHALQHILLMHEQKISIRLYVASKQNAYFGNTYPLFDVLTSPGLVSHKLRTLIKPELLERIYLHCRQKHPYEFHPSKRISNGFIVFQVKVSAYLQYTDFPIRIHMWPLVNIWLSQIFSQRVYIQESFLQDVLAHLSQKPKIRYKKTVNSPDACFFCIVLRKSTYPQIPLWSIYLNFSVLSDCLPNHWISKLPQSSMLTFWYRMHTFSPSVGTVEKWCSSEWHGNILVSMTLTWLLGSWLEPDQIWHYVLQCKMWTRQAWINL